MIAVAEMADGIEKLTAGRRRDALLAALRRLVIEFSDRLFDFNVAAAWAYGRILAAARSAGQPMAIPDAAIAAIASANGCALATRNVKDFATTGLDLVDPTPPHARWVGRRDSGRLASASGRTPTAGPARGTERTHAASFISMASCLPAALVHASERPPSSARCISSLVSRSILPPCPIVRRSLKKF